MSNPRKIRDQTLNCPLEKEINSSVNLTICQKILKNSESLQFTVLEKNFECGENHNVKLRQPHPEDLTYWQSDPVTIWLSNSRSKIQYKYAIHVKEKDYIY